MAAAAVAERFWPLAGRSGGGGRVKANLQLLPIVMAAGWLVGFALAYWAIFCERRGVGLLAWLPVEGAAKTAAGFLLFELGDYARHYAFHKVPLFWRLHRVHHSDPALDATSAFRTHPFENFAQGLVYFAVVAAFGVPLSALLWRTPLLFAALIFQHAHVRLPLWLDRAICVVTPSPRQHRVHHSPDPARADTNFGVLLTLWDRVLGTYVYPGRDESLRTGLDPPREQSLRAFLKEPFASDAGARRR